MNLKALAFLALPLALVGCAADALDEADGPTGTQASALCAAKAPSTTDRFEIVSIQVEGREVEYVALRTSQRAALDLTAGYLERRDGAAQAKCHAGTNASGHSYWACSNSQTYCSCVHYSDGPSCSCQPSVDEC